MTAVPVFCEHDDFVSVVSTGHTRRCHKCTLALANGTRSTLVSISALIAGAKGSARRGEFKR